MDTLDPYVWDPELALKNAKRQDSFDRAVFCVVGENGGGRASLFRRFFADQIAWSRLMVITRPPHFDPDSFPSFFDPRFCTVLCIEAPAISNHEKTPFTFFDAVGAQMAGSLHPEEVRAQVLPVLMTTSKSYKLRLTGNHGEGSIPSFARNLDPEALLQKASVDRRLLRWRTDYKTLEEDLRSLCEAFRARQLEQVLSLN